MIQNQTTVKYNFSCHYNNYFSCLFWINNELQFGICLQCTFSVGFTRISPLKKESIKKEFVVNSKKFIIEI